MVNLPLLIGISGPSGSGKTTISEILANVYHEMGVVCLHEDSYYKDTSHLNPNERQNINFDSPNAIDHALLAEDLSRLKAGLPIPQIECSYTTGKRTIKENLIKSQKIIIIEGVFLFSNETIRQKFDLTVYIKTPKDLCLLRRIERDNENRSIAIENNLLIYKNNVRPGFFNYIHPYKNKSDIIIHNRLEKDDLDLGKLKILIDKKLTYLNSSIQSAEKENEAIIAEQYNAFATTYSELLVGNNLASISTYFSNFNFTLHGKFVLDLGCGDGYDLTLMKNKGAIIFGVDASDQMVSMAQEKNPSGVIKVGFFDKIPFANNFFDLVISKWALQTAYHIDPVYKEISRVLKLNGQLIYLSCHPLRQFIEKKHKEKDYFKKEIVESVIFDGKITVKEPSHTMDEYLSPVFFKHFSLLSYNEGNDAGAEKIDGDIYPSYFIIKARRK